MAEKKIHIFDKKDSTLIYYQQNVDSTTNFLVGFKIPSADLPNEHEHVFRYKNLIVYIDDETQAMRIPLVKPGMLHLMEHCLFHSCKDFKSNELFKYFRKTSTFSNAYTSQNNMTLTISCPTKYLEENLKIASEMLFRTDYKTDLAEEKKTVIHELHSYQDNPPYFYFEQILSNPSLQSGTEILGIADEIIDSITPNEMTRFARTHFTSENLIMSITSDLPYDQIESLFNKYFVEKAKSIPESKVTPKIPRIKLNDDYMVPLVIPEIKTVNLKFYFERQSGYEEQEKMAYLEGYLFNGFNGILMDKFRTERQLCYTPVFQCLPFTENYSFNSFEIQTDVENVNTVINIFTKTIRELAINGISDEQMDGFKEYWKSYRLRKNNIKDRDPNKMLINYIYGKEVFLSNMYEKVASITKEEFNDYFKRNYIDTHIIFQPVGNVADIVLPPIEVITSYIRPYQNYAYNTIYNEKDFEELLDYIQKVSGETTNGQPAIASKIKLIKESDNSLRMKELCKRQEEIMNADDNAENENQTTNSENTSNNNEQTESNFNDSNDDNVYESTTRRVSLIVNNILKAKNNQTKKPNNSNDTENTLQ